MRIFMFRLTFKLKMYWKILLWWIITFKIVNSLAIKLIRMYILCYHSSYECVKRLEIFLEFSSKSIIDTILSEQRYCRMKSSDVEEVSTADRQYCEWTHTVCSYTLKPNVSYLVRVLRFNIQRLIILNGM